mmetsp:Transcript_84420/g.225533  ORF Transcript_84420/g.225533 Transcript_84420/m.225533 type:complete len:207 (+) Transcript_84420:1683-2303(+)
MPLHRSARPSSTIFWTTSLSQEDTQSPASYMVCMISGGDSSINFPVYRWFCRGMVRVVRARSPSVGGRRRAMARRPCWYRCCTSPTDRARGMMVIGPMDISFSITTADSSVFKQSTRTGTRSEADAEFTTEVRVPSARLMRATRFHGPWLAILGTASCTSADSNKTSADTNAPVESCRRAPTHKPSSSAAPTANSSRSTCLLATPE